jgi:hypothetical protein
MYGGGMIDMLDFVLGFAFVAMILSPAALGTCLRHFTRMDPYAAPASHGAHAKARAGMRRAG